MNIFTTGLFSLHYGIFTSLYTLTALWHIHFTIFFTLWYFHFTIHTHCTVTYSLHYFLCTMIFPLHYTHSLPCDIFTALYTLTALWHIHCTALDFPFNSLNQSALLCDNLIFLSPTHITSLLSPSLHRTGYHFPNSLSEAIRITCESPYLSLC